MINAVLLWDNWLKQSCFIILNMPMKYEKYTNLNISEDLMETIFISQGPKGEIKKIIQFIETGSPGMYNLSFGNLLPDGNVDDFSKNDNKDRNKILATVAVVVN